MPLQSTKKVEKQVRKDSVREGGSGERQAAGAGETIGDADGRLDAIQDSIALRMEAEVAALGSEFIA